MNRLSSLIQYLRFHRWKIALLFALIFVFSFVMFPFSDLNDLVSVQVSKATQGQVFVQFEDMQFSLFPNTGLSLEKLSVETPDIGPISVDQLIFLPSIRGLLAQEPSGILKMRGVLKGNLDLSITPGRRTENGNSTYEVSVEGKSLALNELKKVVPVPVNISGKLEISSHGTAEKTFSEQPDLDLEVKVDKFEMQPTTVETQMGPVVVSDLKISKVELKGRLSAGRFNIEKAVIGGATDEVHGTIKGGLSLTVQNRGGLATIPGAYNVDVDLNLSNTATQKFKDFLLLVDSYKTPGPSGNRYAFRVSSTSPEMPPNFGPLR